MISGDRANTVDIRKDAAVAAIRRGLPRRMAAALASVTHTTFYEWLKTDITFASDIELAEAQYAETLLVNVERAGNIANAKTDQLDWKAHAWLLERKHPNEFAQRQQMSVTGQGGGPVEITHALADEDIPARLKAVTALLLESGKLELLEELGLKNGHANGNGHQPPATSAGAAHSSPTPE